MKIALACLFFVVDMLIWCTFSTYLCKKKSILSRTQRFGTFYFVSYKGNLGLPRAKSLQNGHHCYQKPAKWTSLLFAQPAKNRAGYHSQNGFLYDGYERNSEKNMCLILIIINTLKWRIFEQVLTQEKIGTVFGGLVLKIQKKSIVLLWFCWYSSLSEHTTK